METPGVGLADQRHVLPAESGRRDVIRFLPPSDGPVESMSDAMGFRGGRRVGRLKRRRQHLGGFKGFGALGELDALLHRRQAERQACRQDQQRHERIDGGEPAIMADAAQHVCESMQNGARQLKVSEGDLIK